jgi:4'-phosphopantetheinyl transferase
MVPVDGWCKTGGMMTPKPIDSDIVRVRWLPVTAAATQVHLPRWRAMLGVDEFAQADRFAFAADRDTYTAAHALTRAMLSEATGLPTAIWRYARREFGKPILAAEGADTGLRFNISHTRGFVACAIARDEVGLDVEASDRNTDFATADRFFAPEEARLVNAVAPADQACVFFRFWTLKEAFIKATGEGLRRPLDSFSFAFEPLRIAFHPEREDTPSNDDPSAWQFFVCEAAANRPLALALRRPSQRPVRLDIGAAQPADITPR